MPFLAAHRAAVAATWDVDDGTYRALADMIVDDPLQRPIHDQVHPELAPWLRDAILAHAP